MIQLPDNEAAYWHAAAKLPHYKPLLKNLAVDVAIVGGGITGLTAAYLLKRAGLKVAVLEKRTVGSGTTGRTTGKVTSQHNLFYHDLAKRLGDRTAHLYGAANQAGLRQVENIIKQAKIDCDWQRDDNYVYTASPKKAEKFYLESQTAQRIGLPASFVSSAPLPFHIEAAVKFTNQAKFNSQKYLGGLAKVIHGDGSFVFEHSNVIGIHDGEPCRVRTGQGRLSAKHIVVATNVPTLPLMARGAFCLLEYPTESYIVLGRTNGQLTGMYISPDKHHYSILPIKTNGQQLLLIGGESNVSGVRINKEKKYRKLAAYAAKHFGVNEILNKWSDRDYSTYDGPPLVGRMYPWSKHLYVASASRKWGLTNGTAAAMTLRDLITGQPNEWAVVFSPQRLKPITSFPRAAFKQIIS